METIKILQGAFELMSNESLACDVETGGLLIGTLKNPIVFKATNAGMNAIKSHASYTNDVDHDNEILKQLVDESNGRLKLFGFWHKHPFGYDKPSLIDLDVARRIIRRSVKSGDSRKHYFIITNVVNNGVEFYCYALDEDKNFEEVRIKFIDDNAREIEEALKIEPVIIQPREMDFWQDSNFQFYLTKIGYERLQKEVDELRSCHYVVKVCAKGQLYVMISKDNETIVCMPPVEYPLNPPRFFRGNVEVSYSMPLWNSSYGMIDILQNLTALHIQERRHHESHNDKTGSKFIGFINRIEEVIKSLWIH